ncbi:MAG: hypothetical protein Q8T11_06850 [Elusimicrobiota bacterium]|nr:hypothetical protein [Elusimicrobiota bacterium]
MELRGGIVKNKNTTPRISITLAIMALCASGRAAAVEAQIAALK